MSQFQPPQAPFYQQGPPVYQPSVPPLRPIRQANKTTAIILFSVSYAISLFGGYYFGLLILALIMQIVGFVFICLI